MDLEQRVQEMSNDDLKHALQAFGYEPGPVVGTTRRVYENKLLKFAQDAAASGATVDLGSTRAQAHNGYPSAEDNDDEDVVLIDYSATEYTSSQARLSPANTQSPSSPFHVSNISVTPKTPEMSPEDERMEGEERFRFVGPPVYSDDFSKDANVTQIRQRSTVGAGSSSGLYPSLRGESSTGSSKWTGHLEDTSPSPLNVRTTSNQGAQRANLSPRIAAPTDVYGSRASINGDKPMLPLWIKVLLSLVITIFVVMLLRRMAEDGSSSFEDDIIE